jgi:hypothetical protein
MPPQPAAGAIAACVLSVVIALGPHSTATAFSSACTRMQNEHTTLIIDGDLYGLVRTTSRTSGYLFGWSDTPVLSFDEALRLMHELGVKGTIAELLKLPPLSGGESFNAGSIGNFDLHCANGYRATAVVKHAGFTRFWLQQQRGMLQKVTRAYCMPALNLPKGALLSAVFAAPLRATPPSYTVDRNRDGMVDGRGLFHHGGADFPQVSYAKC